VSPKQNLSWSPTRRPWVRLSALGDGLLVEDDFQPTGYGHRANVSWAGWLRAPCERPRRRGDAEWRDELASLHSRRHGERPYAVSGCHTPKVEAVCGCESGNPFCRVARLMTVARSPAHRNQQAAPRATGLIQAEAAGAAPPAAPRTKAEKEKPQPGCHRLSMDGQARPQRCPIPRGICDISWPARGSW
jgi:hypothetical protein